MISLALLRALEVPEAGNPNRVVIDAAPQTVSPSPPARCHWPNRDELFGPHYVEFVKQIHSRIMMRHDAFHPCSWGSAAHGIVWPAALSGLGIV